MCGGGGIKSNNLHLVLNNTVLGIRQMFSKQIFIAIAIIDVFSVLSVVTQTELSAVFDGQNFLVVSATPSSPSYKITPPSQSREESNVYPPSCRVIFLRECAQMGCCPSGNSGLFQGML